MPIPDKGQDAVAGIARRHGFSPEAAQAMLAALVGGNGRQAQFDHPEFGGMGQWSGGGMLMIGDMFNSSLKARVGDLIQDLTGLAQALAQRPAASTPSQPGGGSGQAWPPDLGMVSASGSQNGMDYAVFPDARRLAIRRGGQVSLYDTGDHRIGGVSQQQGGPGGLVFTSQHGQVQMDSLTRVPDGQKADDAQQDTGVPDTSSASQPAQASVLTMIEQLHALLSRGVLTQAEFDAKKAELLSRL